MTLILSEENDQSTNYVIDWLIYYNHKFVRDNGNSLMSVFNLTKISLTYEIEKKEYSFTNDNTELGKGRICSIWYRRPYIGVENFITNENPNSNKINSNKTLKNNLINHNKTVKSIVMNLIEKNCFHLGNYSIDSLNKVFVLEKADELGFDIPKTIVTNSKIDLKNFIEKIIIK